MRNSKETEILPYLLADLPSQGPASMVLGTGERIGHGKKHGLLPGGPSALNQRR
jgi:hypothetical protein